MAIDFSKINDPEEQELQEFLTEGDDELMDFEPDFPSREDWEPDYCLELTMEEP